MYTGNGSIIRASCVTPQGKICRASSKRCLEPGNAAAYCSTSLRVAVAGMKGLQANGRREPAGGTKTTPSVYTSRLTPAVRPSPRDHRQRRDLLLEDVLEHDRVELRQPRQGVMRQQ